MHSMKSKKIDSCFPVIILFGIEGYNQKIGIRCLTQHLDTGSLMNDLIIV